MTFITLNLWGGKIFDPLMDFLKQRVDSTDIFYWNFRFQFTHEMI